MCDLNVYKESSPVTNKADCLSMRNRNSVFSLARVLSTGWLSISAVALVRFMFTKGQHLVERALENLERKYKNQFKDILSRLGADTV